MEEGKEVEHPGKIRSFEDLFVFREALALTNEMYRVTRQGGFSKDYGLADQMRRSAVSILSNIAEGFERETTPELIRALYIAKGSCGEVRAQLFVAYAQKYITPAENEALTVKCKKISAGLYKMITQLRSRAR